MKNWMGFYQLVGSNNQILADIARGRQISRKIKFFKRKTCFPECHHELGDKDIP